VNTDRIDSEGYKLYIGNLDFKTTERDLEDKFGKYGKIMDVYIPREPRTMQSRGFAFVTFHDRRDAEDAEDATNDRMFEGRIVKVNMARSRPPMHESRAARMGYGAAYGRREVCRDYSRGMCDRGTRCRFSHDSSGGYNDDSRDRDRDHSSRDRDRDHSSRDRDRDYSSRDRDYSSRDRDRDYGRDRDDDRYHDRR